MTHYDNGLSDYIASDSPVDTDRVLIIGAGLAGLFLALRLAPRPCTIVSPVPLGGASSSAWAQGGLAAALSPQDSPEQHADDTVKAGAGLVDPRIARMIAEEGPQRVYDLIALGVPFDRTPKGDLALSLEAAHSHPRVARVSGDLAGKAIMDALTAATHAAPHIDLVEHQRAISLLQDAGGRAAGAIIEDQQGRRTAFAAAHTIMCTGGSGGLFRITTNPPEARGDAIAMAYSAGAVLADLEFIQFHPTAMDVGLDPAPLATEALRGEGAILRNSAGHAFMRDYHTDGELAPRDAVARAIHTELNAGRQTFLDTRQALGARIETHFPTVYRACRNATIDPVEDMIPIAPAMHYHMGGILTDIWGQTSVAGLSACGECASTGAHGANRLASNSLLEAVVMAARIADRLRDTDFPRPGPSRAPIAPTLPEMELQALRHGMARHCGVVRSETGLAHLNADIQQWIEQHGPSHTLRVAEQIVAAANARRESRGGHYRSDFPNPMPLAAHSYSSRAPNQHPSRLEPVS